MLYTSNESPMDAAFHFQENIYIHPVFKWFLQYVCLNDVLIFDDIVKYRGGISHVERGRHNRLHNDYLYGRPVTAFIVAEMLEDKSDIWLEKA